MDILNSTVKLLFVCTGNACRSQMAEGWARELSRQFGFPHFEADSAGLEAHGLNPRATAAMAACKVDISQQQSKILTTEMLDAADVIITVCGHADSNCPVIPAVLPKIHLPFDDPARAEGSEAEITRVFDKVCLEIRDGIAALLSRLAEKMHRDAPFESHFDHRHVEVLSRKQERDEFIPLQVLHLRHRLYRGGWSADLRRELVTRPRAVGALLYDPIVDKVVLIRQFRAGLVDESERPWLLEIVAGLAAAGEALVDVVQRETFEETNCRISRILPICEYFNSPGWNNEKVSLFCAQVDSSTADGVHGLDEENEDILVVALSVDDALNALKSGKINNAMSIIALQWLELNKDWVRTQWQGTGNRR